MLSHHDWWLLWNFQRASEFLRPAQPSSCPYWQACKPCVWTLSRSKQWKIWRFSRARYAGGNMFAAYRENQHAWWRDVQVENHNFNMFTHIICRISLRLTWKNPPRLMELFSKGPLRHPLSQRCTWVEHSIEILETQTRDDMNLGHLISFLCSFAVPRPFF